MKDLLFQLKNHTRNSPETNAALMNRTVEVLESYRAITVDMLAALSWLDQEKKLPKEVDMFKFEMNARDLLDISHSTVRTIDRLRNTEMIEVINIIGKHDTPPDTTGRNLPSYKICPRCGDRNAKIVHLRRRPKAGLECAACRYEYPFPARWI